MERIIEAALMAVGIGIAAGILAVLAAVPWKRSTSPCVRFRVAVPLLLGAAFIAALVAKEGWVGRTPDASWLSVVHVIGAVSALAIITAALPRRWWLGLVMAVGAAVATGWLLRVPASVEPQAMRWKLIAAGGTLLGWLALEPLATKRNGVTLPLGLSLSFIAAFLLLLDRMNFARAAPPLAAVAAGLGMIALGALIKPRIHLARGALIAVLPMLMSMIAVGWLAVRDYTALNWWVPLAVAAAPLGLWLGELPVLRRKPAWLRVSVAVLAVIVIAGGSIAFAALTAEPDPYAY